MSLNLKIKFPASGVMKTMRFAETMSVHEACGVILEKGGQGGKDHGMFLVTESDPLCLGKWLKPDRALEFYDLKTNDLVEYKKRHDVIKISYYDANKTLMLDLSTDVDTLLEAIGEKIGIKSAEEYGLLPEGKTDWLKGQISIPEQVKTMEQVFTLKQKYFMSDANVDTSDPMQLHLVYCQTRDDIRAGRHPMTLQEAVTFAALQMQVQVNNFNPDVHKSGYTVMSDVFAPQFRKKANEAGMFVEWKKLVGMSDVNAKYRYVQQARTLKTYGMTCFQVKEKVPGKKKLMDALLCFTRENILRMEYETKRVIKEYTFKQLLRWAATPETFTLDFGAYEEDYVVVVTKEGEQIASLIAGYIDLLLKKQRSTGVVIADDDAEVASVQSLARVGGIATTTISTTTTARSGPDGYAAEVTDVAGAGLAIERMINDLFGEVARVDDASLSGAQRQALLAQHARSLQDLAGNIEGLARSGDRVALNAAAQQIVVSTEQMISAARQAKASGADPNGILMNASKGVSEALKNLLRAAQNAANNPTDPDAIMALTRAKEAAMAALQKLDAASRGVYADDAYQHLFREVAKAVDANAKLMARGAEGASGTIGDAGRRQVLLNAIRAMDSAAANMAGVADIVAPTSQDEACVATLQRAGQQLQTDAAQLLATAQASGVDPVTLQAMHAAQQRLAEALGNLLGVTQIPEMSGAKDADEFTEAAQIILQNAAALMASEGNPQMMKECSTAIKNGAQRLGQAGRGVASQSDDASKERMAGYLRQVIEGTKRLLQTVPVCVRDPNDKSSHKVLVGAAQEVAEATQQLVEDSGRQVALAALYNAAKLACASTTTLATSSHKAQGHLTDPAVQDQLAQTNAAAAAAVGDLLRVLQASAEVGPDGRKRLVPKEDIVPACDAFAPVAYKLVSVSKSAGGRISDPDTKKDVMFASTNAAKALHKLLSNRKAMKAIRGQLEAAEALEAFKAAAADLDAAILGADQGMLQPTMEKDAALNALARGIGELGGASKNLATTAKNSPEDLGAAMHRMAEAVTGACTAGTALAACVEDKTLQKAILNSLKVAVGEMQTLMQVSKATAQSPDDANLNRLLVDASRGVAEALVELTQTSKQVVPKQVEDFQASEAAKLESLAEKELRGAASVIEACVRKLTEATEAARAKRSQEGIDVDEQNIQEAILEAAQAIAMATSTLIHSATAVQQDFQKLQGTEAQAAAASGTSYHRDPQWAEGLISAAKTVAGSVQHLVGAANASVDGSASEEALVVAAQQVSAATTQLVMASTVKADPNSENQQRLRGAAQKVTAATEGLVAAARSAAQFKEEQVVEQDKEKYALSNSKIAEMEQQMLILKMEKELERARQGLSGMRKAQYAGAGGETAAAAAPAPAAAPAAGALPPPPAGSALPPPPAGAVGVAPKRGMAGPKRGMAGPKRGMMGPKRGMAPGRRGMAPGGRGRGMPPAPKRA